MANLDAPFKLTFREKKMQLQLSITSSANFKPEGFKEKRCSNTSNSASFKTEGFIACAKSPYSLIQAGYKEHRQLYRCKLGWPFQSGPDLDPVKVSKWHRFSWASAAARAQENLSLVGWNGLSNELKVGKTEGRDRSMLISVVVIYCVLLRIEMFTIDFFVIIYIAIYLYTIYVYE